MNTTRSLVLILGLLFILSAGCLQVNEETESRPAMENQTPPANGTSLDLDPLFDNQTDPVGNLTIVTLPTGEATQITMRPSASPWYAGPDRILHESFVNGSRKLAVTTLQSSQPRTDLYNGSLSASEGAESPSFAPAQESVYFTHTSSKSPPKLVQRNLTLSGDETVLTELRAQHIPQSPWSVSPNGSLLAVGAWTGAADGPQTQIIIRNGSDGEPWSHAGSPLYGNNPQFVSNASIVFDRGNLLRANLETGDTDRLLESGEKDNFSFPVVASGWIWFTVQVKAGEHSDPHEEIRRMPVGGGPVETIAHSQAYQLGRFDVGPDGKDMVLAVQLQTESSITKG